ncbi:MAG: response regulator [Nitrospinae bacterium]|nr:response regulator [Nitrospinota bacterium]
MKMDMTACKSGTVLLVEDDPLMSDVLNYELQNMGHSVLNAENGVEALIALETFRPDIIITDLMMPEMDGYELIRSVRQSETHRDVPIIAMSASIAQHIRDLVLKLGANEFMTKPFSFSKLEWYIENHLSRRNGKEEMEASA